MRVVRIPTREAQDLSARIMRLRALRSAPEFECLTSRLRRFA